MTHSWGRELETLGHFVSLIPPICNKTFVKRKKNDAVDAKAIVEAALRPTIPFVAVKTSDQQARVMLFRTRLLFVGQRTQMINAFCGHLAHHGLVAATGTAHQRLCHAARDAPIKGLATIWQDQIGKIALTVPGRVIAFSTLLRHGGAYRNLTSP